MEKRKEVQDNSKKIISFLLKFLGGFAQKISLNLILNAKKQVDEIILQFKKGLIAGSLVVFGLFFIFNGLAIYLDSVIGVFSGSGYLTIGLAGVLMAFLVILFKK